ncbi:MAG TPA: orotidine-5'-phosphate decarboxylase [Opitutales bacterium]|nr:orotidine-5'-phosphate decarboxylase [Opitutales bacterium]
MHAFDRILRRSAEIKSLCVAGLDPNLDLMPANFVAQYDLGGPMWADELARLFFDYNKLFVEATAGLVAAVKPQAAYYEALGAPGIASLASIVRFCRERDLPVILDAKRNDIGSTSEAYARAYLSGGVVKGAPPAIEADALTVNPYMGADSLAPFVKAAQQAKKGLFVLVKTSNPGSKDFQDLPLGDATLAARVAKMVDDLGRDTIGPSGFSAVGAVVGATFPSEAEALRKLMPHALFLVPGIGAQGGDVRMVRAFLNTDGRGAVVNASRSVYYPADKNVAVASLPEIFRDNVEKLRESINRNI